MSSPLHAQDGAPIGLADYAAYRAALNRPKADAEPSQSATFRDLWDRPDVFRGRRVTVQGRVEQVFHQGPVGQFPALAEVWIVNTATDPLCLSFPESGDSRAPKPGDSVQFEGTFLRKIRYRGGDVDRLAPLIVGPAAPRVEKSTMPAASAVTSSPFEGVFLLVVGGIVLLMLVLGHLLRHPSTAVVIGPPPVFEDGTAAGDEHRVGWSEGATNGARDGGQAHGE